MKSILSKIASTLLALLVLFSTLSFTVEKHYCGEFLMDVSFTGDVQDCGMDMESVAKSKKKNCCKDEIHHIEGQDKLQQNLIDDLDLNKQQFVAAFLLSYKDLFITNESKSKFYKDFSPPDVPKDYQILFQTFLI